MAQPHWQQEEFFNNLFAVVILILVPSAFISSFLKSRYCPQCKTFKLKRTYKTLVPATIFKSGKRLVICDCQNCSYHNEFEEIISTGGHDGGSGGGGGGG